MNIDKLCTEARWRATVFYRSQKGTVDVEYYLIELDELAQRIEAGPHWDTIIKIEIVRINHVDSPDLTIEKAAEI